MIHFFGSNQTKEVRKFIAISVILLLVISVLAYIFFRQSNSTLLQKKGIAAVPLHASAILQFNNTDAFLQNINQNTFFENLLGDSGLHELLFLKKVFTEIAAPGKELASCPITLSAHQANAGGIDFLFVAELDHPNHWSKAEKVFSALISVKNTLNARKVDNHTVYDLHFGESGKNICFSLQNNLLLASISPFLVEDAIRQLNSGEDVLNNAELSDPGSDRESAQLYLNFRTLPNTVYSLLNNNCKNALNFIKNTGSWSHFSLSIRKNILLMNGFTAKPEQADAYLSLLQGQQPVATETCDLFPNRTAAFVSLGISDYKAFKARNELYLQKTAQQTSAQATRIYASKKYGIELDQEIASWLGTEMALIITENNGDSIQNNQLAFIKTTDPEKASALLDRLAGIDSVANKKTAYIINYRKQKIYPIGLPGFLPAVGGSLFNSLKYPYALVLNEHLICANQVDELKKYIDDFLSLQTFEQNEQFKQLKAYAAANGNLFAFACTERNLQLIRNSTQLGIDAIFNNRPIDFKNLYGAFYQISNNNNRLFSTIAIKYNSNNNVKTGLLWSLALDQPMSMQPQVVINHTNKEQEIAIQDDGNVLYLISNTGKVIWKKQLSEKIISSIYQVDFYKNDKLQMVFNSAERLYMIDRLGNMVAGYPIRLSSPASSGLAVFDYEKDENYRIFVPCSNKAVYGYQVTGKPLEGWAPKSNIGLVTQPVQYLHIEGKDYLVISNNEGAVFIFNRKGQVIKELKAQEKATFQNPFVADETSKPGETQFVTSNTAGTIQRYYLNGTVGNRKLGVWTENHFFDFNNVAGGDAKEYIFLDKELLAVYSKEDTALVYSYEFLNDLTLRPQFIPVDSNKNRVGVVNASTNQVFCFDDNGKIVPGFPLKGSTPFSVSNFRNDGQRYLLVGSNDKYLYVYGLD